MSTMYHRHPGINFNTVSDFKTTKTERTTINLEINISTSSQKKFSTIPFACRGLVLSFGPKGYVNQMYVACGIIIVYFRGVSYNRMYHTSKYDDMICT